MVEDFQFNMSSDDCEPLESLLARCASIRDLLQNGVVSANIARGTLILKDRSAKLIALKHLLKANGCTFDNATKTWRRPSATVAERYAVDVLKARESARNARAVGEKDAIVDAIMAQVNAADAQRRDSTWVGMPCVPTREVNLERHAHEPPTSFG